MRILVVISAMAALLPAMTAVRAEGIAPIERFETEADPAHESFTHHIRWNLPELKSSDIGRVWLHGKRSLFWSTEAGAHGHHYISIQPINQPQLSVGEVATILKVQFTSLFPGGAYSLDPNGSTIKLDRHFKLVTGALDEWKVIVPGIQWGIHKNPISLPAEVEVTSVEPSGFTLTAIPGAHILKGSVLLTIVQGRDGLWLIQEGLGVENESEGEAGMADSVARPMWHILGRNLRLALHTATPQDHIEKAAEHITIQKLGGRILDALVFGAGK